MTTQRLYAWTDSTFSTGLTVYTTTETPTTGIAIKDNTGNDYSNPFEYGEYSLNGLISGTDGSTYIQIGAYPI